MPKEVEVYRSKACDAVSKRQKDLVKQDQRPSEPETWSDRKESSSITVFHDRAALIRSSGETVWQNTMRSNDVFRNLSTDAIEELLGSDSNNGKYRELIKRIKGEVSR